MMNRTEYRPPQMLWFPIFVAIAVTVVCFMPALHWAGFAAHDNHRIAQVSLAVLGGVAVILHLIRPNHAAPLLGKAAVFFLLGFFSLGLLSGVFAWSVQHAMFEWANFGLLFALSWLIAKNIRAAQGSRMVDRILLICGAGCAVYVFSWSIIYASWLIVGNQLDWMTLLPGFDNYRFFNHIQTVTLPLLGLLAVRSRQFVPTLSTSHIPTLMGLMQRNQARFWAVILVLWWTLFFVTAGRGTLLGLVIGISMALVWRRKRAWDWCRIMLSTFAVGLTAYPVLYIFLPHLTGVKPFGLLQEAAARSIANPTSDRWALWHSALQMIIDHPLLGVGPLHFAHFGRHILNGAHPHNWVLQIGSEWGIPALLCMVVVLVIALRAMLRAGRNVKSEDAPNQAILATWLATFVAIVVDGLVSGLLVMPSSQLWIVLYAGCAWGWTASFTRAVTPIPRRMRPSQRYVVMLGIVVLTLFAARGLWPEIKNLPPHEEKILNEGLKSGSDRLFPRIWRAGYF